MSDSTDPPRVGGSQQGPAVPDPPPYPGQSYPPPPYPGQSYPPPPYPGQSYPPPYPGRAAPTSRAAYRSPSLLGTFTIAVAAIMVGVELVEALAAWASRDDYIRAAEQGVAPGDMPLTAYDWASILWLFAGIAAYVVTCLWLYRVRANAEVLSPFDEHTRAKIWAWLGWCVPIVAFWFPFQVVRDVRRSGRGTSRDTAMVGWWWLLWLISLLLPQIWYVTNPEPVSIRTANTMPWVETAGAVVVLVCFLLWVQIVRGITSDQVATAAGFGEPVP